MLYSLFVAADNHTQRLSRAIDAAYEDYKANKPNSENLLIRAFRSQASNILWHHLRPDAPDPTLELEIAHRAFMQLGTFRGKSKLSTWFYRLAQNEVDRVLRAYVLDRKRRVSLEVNLDSDEPSDNEPAAKPVNLDDPISVDLLLRKLPEKQKEVLESQLEGLSLEEVAKKKAEPLGTIRSRHRLAKARARKPNRK